MPFEPAFMRDLDAFRRALAAVRGQPAWSAFQRRWFADQPWPRRTAEAIAALRPGAQEVVDGRTFVRAPLPLDLEPEARYEYFSALRAGFEAVFTAPSDAPGAGGSGVRFQCPACEWWTDDAGPDTCPGCGRPLLPLRREPARG